MDLTPDACAPYLTPLLEGKGGLLCWLGVIVHMRPFGVVLVLILAGIVVAVGEFVVVVRMRVPVGLVLPLAAEATAMLVSDVIMVVAVGRRRMCMFRRAALPLGVLLCSQTAVSCPCYSLICL